MPMGQSDLGNPSTEIPFSVDSRLYQVDRLKLNWTTLKVNLVRAIFRETIDVSLRLYWIHCVVLVNLAFLTGLSFVCSLSKS